MERKDCLEMLKRWVAEVGELQIARLNQHDLKIESKSTEIDLVTEVDKLSEELLVEKIKFAFPGDAILAEENGCYGDKAADYRWVIDPLDGTINYAQGFPLFCISIALQHCQQTIVGVVYAPVLREMFWATLGEGAYLNGKRLQVSEKTKLSQGVLATGFPYDRAIHPDNNVNFFSKIVTKVRGIRRTGSAAYDLCNVAAGRFDGYWELKLNLWDIAAAQLIVKEAGGIVRPLSDCSSIAIIAANATMAQVIYEQIHN